MNTINTINYWNIFTDYNIPVMERAAGGALLPVMGPIALLGASCSGEPQQYSDKPLPFPRDAGSRVPDANLSDANSSAFVLDAGFLPDSGPSCVPDVCESNILFSPPHHVPSNPPMAETAGRRPLAEGQPICLKFEKQELNNFAVPHGGISVVDLDGDGFQDVYLLNTGSPNLFLRNTGNGFEDASQRFGLSIGGDSVDAAWGDFDEDGDLDLFLVGNQESILYENNNGHFVPRPDLIHYDQNGRAALWIGSRLLLSTDWRTLVFPAEDIDTATQLAVTTGLDDIYDGARILSADLNGDGLEDVLLVNQTGRHRYFEKQADGTYRSREMETDLQVPVPVKNAEIVRLNNNDGQTHRSAPTFIYFSRQNGRNYLMQLQNGTFVDRAQALGLQDTGPTTASAWGDALNVGYPFVALGHFNESNLFYVPVLENGMISYFDPQGEALGLAVSGPTIGVAWINHAGNSLLDLLVVMADGRVILFKNQSEVKTCSTK